MLWEIEIFEDKAICTPRGQGWGQAGCRIFAGGILRALAVLCPNGYIAHQLKGDFLTYIVEAR